VASTNLDFAAAIGEFAKETEAKILAVFQGSADDVIDLMRAYTPIQFGYLAGTIQAALNNPVPIDPTAAGNPKAPISPNASAGDIALVITDAKLGDVIYGCFTMSYGPYVEFGTSKMAPRGMVRRAAMQWQQIVDANVTLAQSRAS
jgi:hypothetical protein